MRTPLQTWSSHRNWYKRNLSYSRNKLKQFINNGTNSLTTLSDGTYIQLLGENEVIKLKEAERLLDEVNDEYKKNHYELRNKVK